MCNIAVQDSFNPPESASEVQNINVMPPLFHIGSNLPSKLLLNHPVNARIAGVGGVPPYEYTLSGTLPPGLSFDSNSGQISGSPTTIGSYAFTVEVFGFIGHSIQGFTVEVAQPLGRNDRPANATPIGNGLIGGSISPYIDPPNGPPTAGDQDYYKVVSLGGATVHVETSTFPTESLLDTVLEIVDGNGIRLATCRQPGDTSQSFNSSCINDDISLSPHVKNSALDFRVQGAPNVSTPFYIHVLDWRGDARPDMQYGLSVSGVTPPLSVLTTSLPPAARGFPYSRFRQLAMLRAS